MIGNLRKEGKSLTDSGYDNPEGAFGAKIVSQRVASGRLARVNTPLLLRRVSLTL